MIEYDLYEKCNLCYGESELILVNFNEKELIDINSSWNVDYLKNGRNACPHCKGSGYKNLDTFELEEN